VSIISVRRKSRAETQPTVSKTRPTRRRPIEARLQGHPLRVNAADLPRRRFLHLAASAAALQSHSGNASAVDDVLGAGDCAGTRRNEKGHQLRDLVRLRRSADGMPSDSVKPFCAVS
jgi:hypothetical protein